MANIGGSLICWLVSIKRNSLPKGSLRNQAPFLVFITYHQEQTHLKAQLALSIFFLLSQAPADK